MTIPSKVNIERYVLLEEQLRINNIHNGPSLYINQTSNENVVDIQQNNNSFFYIENDGNVGIGTNNPNSRLHVNGIITGNGSQITNLNYDNITNQPVIDNVSDSNFDLKLSNKTTTNLIEGSNLYYTDERVEQHILSKNLISLTNCNLNNNELLYYSGESWCNLKIDETTLEITTDRVLRVIGGTSSGNLNQVVYENETTTVTSNIEKPIVLETYLSEEREYPPAGKRDFVPTSGTDLSYTKTISHTYGSGDYTIKVSNYNSIHSQYHPIETFNEADGVAGMWQYNQYTAATLTYIDSNFNDNGGKFSSLGYKGDWIYIKLPVYINLTKFKFKQRANTTDAKNAPGDFKIYGSNDETNWTELVSASISPSDYSSYVYESSVSTNGEYQYFLLIVNKLVGPVEYTNNLNLDEWYIYGKENFTTAAEEEILVTDGLIAHYKFDGNYNDSSGNNYHLTNHNASTQSTHIIDGEAVEFDNSDYLEFPSQINPYTIWNGNGITFSFWFRVTSSGKWARFIDFQEAASTDNGIFIGRHSTNNTIYVYMNDNVYVSISVANFTDATWYHFILSVDTSGNWKVYINNVNKNISQTQTIPNISYNLRYINKSTYSSDGNWDGQMDDFRIYNRALSAAEVEKLYNAQYIQKGSISGSTDEYIAFKYNPNTAVSNQTEYTINFPQATDCEILLLDDINYNHLETPLESLNGTYTIKVGTTESSISKSGYTKTTAIGGTAISSGYSTDIKGTTQNYNSKEVIIRYKTQTVTTVTRSDPKLSSLSSLTPEVNSLLYFNTSNTVNYLELDPTTLEITTDNKLKVIGGGGGGGNTVIINSNETTSNLLPPSLVDMSVEREYPPTRTLNAETSTISAQSYGNGTYIVTGSDHGWIEGPYTAFAGSGSFTNRPSTRANTYSSGVYQINGATDEGEIDSTYKGCWIKIKLPVSIQLTKYKIEQDISNYNDYRAPGKFKVYGSNDDSTWTMIDDQSTNIVSYGSTEPHSYENSLNDTNEYNYFAIVVQHLSDTNSTYSTVLKFNELYIYGKENFTTADGLIAHYKFDGSATDMLLDSSGNNHHLTNTGATFNGTEYVLGDGATELAYLEFPSTINPYSIWNGNGITFSCWFKLDTTTPNYSRIFDFSDSTNNNNVIIYKHSSTNKLAFNVKVSGSANIEYSANDLVDNQWHFMSWSINASGNWTIYIDNVLEVLNDVNQPRTIANFTATNRYIGYEPPNNIETDGVIDDFRIYDRALSAAEVEKLYYAQYIQKGSISGSTDEYIAFKYNPNTELRFVFREDESPYSWQEAYDEAIANGGRMATKTELLAYLSGLGYTLTSPNNQTALYVGDQWVWVSASNAIGKDAIQIGDASNHYVGKSHYDSFSSTTFYGSRTNSYNRIYLEVYDYTEYTINFPQATDCEILLLDDTNYNHLETPLESLNGTYTVKVGTTESSISKSGYTKNTIDGTSISSGYLTDIKGTSQTYSNKEVIIRYKTQTITTVTRSDPKLSSLSSLTPELNSLLYFNTSNTVNYLELDPTTLEITTDNKLKVIGGGGTQVLIQNESDTITSNLEKPIIDSISNLVTDGLIAHYKFDGDLTDSSGNNHNLSSIGTIEYDTSTYIYGKSSYLSGDDHFQTPSSLNPYNIWNDNGITISGWFKLKPTSVDWATLFEIYQDGSNRITLAKNYNANNLWFGKNNNGSFIQQTNNSDVFDDTWHHIVITIDVNGNAILYVDNVANTTLANITLTSSYTNLNISYTAAASVIWRFNGNLDDFRIYNRVLSTEEIEKLYNAQYIQKSLITNSTDEVVYFKYNENNDNGSGQTEYTINFPEETECDILIVAGGGGGGAVEVTNTSGTGAGGGGGGVIFLQNQTISTGTYIIKVGNGGEGDKKGDATRTTGQRGYNSSFNYLQTEAIGGGGGGTRIGGAGGDNTIGTSGGSGGGSSHNVSGSINNGGTGTVSNILKADGTVLVTNYRQGYDGGVTIYESPYSSGGGGAGGNGYGSADTPDDGAGGIGRAVENEIDFNTHFNIPSGIGEHHTDGKVYLAGGGSSGYRSNDTNHSVGGLGGGGSSTSEIAENGTPHTGGGGGGCRSGSAGAGDGGNGGSGIVIIRYKTQTVTTVTRVDPKLSSLSSLTPELNSLLYFNTSNTVNYLELDPTTLEITTDNKLKVIGGGGGTQVLIQNESDTIISNLEKPIIDSNSNLVTDGLIAHYKFDGDLDNAVGTNELSINPANTSGNITYINDGLFEEALDLDTFKYVLDSQSVLNAYNSAYFSVSLWFKIYATVSPGLMILSKYEDGSYRGSSRGGLQIIVQSNNTIRVERLNSSVSWQKNYSTAISLNTWVYLTVVCDGNDTRLYVNNTHQETETSASGWNTMSSTTSTGSTDYRWGIGTYLFDGTIHSHTASIDDTPEYYLDDFRIYDRALSAAEVEKLYYAQYIQKGSISGSTDEYIAFKYNPNIPQPDLVSQKTGVSGWRLVRYLVNGSTSWHPQNDNLAGTAVYGTAYDNTNNWSVAFGSHDEIVCGTYDLTYWVYFNKSQLAGDTGTAGANKTIIKSSKQNTTYQAEWYDRALNTEDPWISVEDHMSSPTYMVYGEAGNNSHHLSLLSGYGGMAVWVRSTGATSLYTEYTINFPQATECEILLLDDTNYNHLETPLESLNGTYTVKVGTIESSISNSTYAKTTKGGTSITSGYLTDIKGTTQNYNSKEVIIRYKTQTVTTVTRSDPKLSSLSSLTPELNSLLYFNTSNTVNYLELDPTTLEITSNNQLSVIRGSTSSGVDGIDGTSTTILEISKHIIPDTNATYDIGSAEKKIRHLYLSDNSLWIGDDNKFSISEGKMRIKKRKRNIIPSKLLELEPTINETKILNLSEKQSLNDLNLGDWEKYVKENYPELNLFGSDLFQNKDDYELNATTDAWIETSDKNILISDYYSNIGIGEVEPKYKLDVKGDINLTGKLYKNGIDYDSNIILFEKQNLSNNDILYYNNGNWSNLKLDENSLEISNDNKLKLIDTLLNRITELENRISVLENP